MEHTRLKKWEIALVLALCLTLCWSFIFGETECCAWWGVIYPELTRAGESAETFAAAGPAQIELHWQLLEWLKGLFPNAFA